MAEPLANIANEQLHEIRRIKVPRVFKSDVLT